MNRIAVLSPLGDKLCFAVLPILVAVSMGLLTATQPPALMLVLFGVASLILLLTITPFSAFMLLMILTPMRTLIQTESSFQLPLEIGQLTVLVMMAAWAVHRIVHGHKLLDFTWSSIYIPLIGFITIGGLTIFNAISVGAWLNEWLKWVLMLIMAVLVVSIAGKLRWEWLVLGLVMAGIANALIGFYIFFGGSGALHLLINNRFFRAFGTFGQPNPFGGFMGLLTPLALTAALGYLMIFWSRWRQTKQIAIELIIPLIFYSSAFVLIAGGVIISWSRGAWLAFVVSIAMIMVALPRKIWQGLGLLFAASLLIAGLWLTGKLPISIAERIQSSTAELFTFDDVRALDITPENYAVVERLAHWQAATNMAWNNPWFGVGLGNYEAAYARYRLINWDMALGHAHNSYLNVLAETGIIGLSVYVVLWISIVYFTWWTRKHPDLIARYVAVGLLGTWTYMTVHSLTDNLYVNNIFLHLGVMLGILATLYGQTWKSYKVGANDPS